MFDAADDLRLKRVEAKLDLIPVSLLISERLARIESKLDQLIILAGSGASPEEVAEIAAKLKADRERLTAATEAAKPK